MRIDYVIADPAKNITALVSSPVPPEMRPFVAEKVMKDSPETEQVGFVYTDENGGFHLDMAGGEFCGNATMSAACLFFAENKQNPRFDKKGICLYASGCKTPLRVNFDNIYKDRFDCTVEMPLPLTCHGENLFFEGREYEVFTVDFGGIVHVISRDRWDKDTAEKAVKAWCLQKKCPALGLMQYDTAAQRLLPLVYVPVADTLFWENSCASGTTALAVWLSQTEKAENKEIIQPGGVLKITVSDTGTVFLSSSVILSPLHTLYIRDC